MIKSLVLAIAILFVAAPAGAQDGHGAATQSATQQMNYLGTSGSVVQNVGNPMTGGQMMTTPDGQKSFNAKITCPNSQKYMEVFIQPSGTGDLGTVYVAHDVDYDGNFDYTLSLPFVVSGVCGNGVITCNPGTWNNCIPMKWAIQDDGHVTLQNAAWGELGGCYCINNSCGVSLAWGNTASILRDLGGGVAAAIQRKNPKKVVSAAKIQNFSITYYGQNTGSCTSASGMSGMADPSGTFAMGKTDGLLVAQKNSEVEAQSLDPTSYYSIIKNSAALNKPTANSCVVARKVTLNENHNCAYSGSYVGGGICEDQGGNCGTYCASLSGCSIEQTGVAAQVSGSAINPGWNLSCGEQGLFFGPAFISIQGLTGCTGTELSERFTLPAGETPDLEALGYPGAVGVECRVSTSSTTFNGHYVSRNYGTYVCMPPTPEGDSCSQTSLTLCNDRRLTWTGTYLYGNTTYFYPVWIAGGGGSITYGAPGSSGTISTGYLAKCRFPATVWDDVFETVDDKCQAFESDSKCKIQSETVDGVATIQNFVPTFLSPFENCKTYTGVQSHSLCRQWWVKNRTYQCENQNTNWDYVKNRAKVIANSASGDTTQFQYSDVRYNGSTWVSESTSTTGITTQNFNHETCEQACKLRTVVADNRAGAIGQAQQLMASPTHYKYTYKRCSKAGVNTGCPIEAGEELVRDCQCINEFAEALTIFAVLGDAGDDVICSSGVRK